MDPLEPDRGEPVDETPAPVPLADPGHTETAPPIGHRNIAEWHGRELVDRDGERIGKLEHVYFDVETEEPQFATVKEGMFGRHLTLVPLVAYTAMPPDASESCTLVLTMAVVAVGPSSRPHCVPLKADRNPSAEPVVPSPK